VAFAVFSGSGSVTFNYALHTDNSQFMAANCSSMDL